MGIIFTYCWPGYLAPLYRAEWSRDDEVASVPNEWEYVEMETSVPIHCSCPSPCRPDSPAFFHALWGSCSACDHALMCVFGFQPGTESPSTRDLVLTVLIMELSPGFAVHLDYYPMVRQPSRCGNDAPDVHLVEDGTCIWRNQIHDSFYCDRSIALTVKARHSFTGRQCS